METLQSQLNKYRHFVATMRHLNPELKQGERIMVSQTEQQPTSRVTAKAANKRYKRSPEELDADIEKVDQLIASGKYNQLEALKLVGLQSSVYHYRKRQEKLKPAKSLKPRKFAPRPNRKASYEERKQNLLKEVENKVEAKPSKREEFKARSVEQELLLLRAKYDKLKEYVVNNVILKERN